MLKSKGVIHKISIELKLFVGFNLIYFISLILNKDINLNLIFALIVAYSFLVNFNRVYRADKYYLIYTIIILFLFLYGLVRSNFTSYIFFDLMCFIAFYLTFTKSMFANANNFYLNEVPKFAYIISWISLISMLIYISIYGFTIASIENGRGLDDLATKLMSPKYFLAASIFLYPLKFYFNNKKSKLIFEINILLYILFGLAMGSRGTTIIGIIIFIVTNIINVDLISKNKSFSIKNFISSVFFVLFILIFLYQIESVKLAINYLIFRFETENLGQDRSVEALFIYNDLSLIEIIIGRGLGAANNYWNFDDNANGVNIVHYGWMFLILKGGFLLLAIVYLKILHSMITMMMFNFLRPYSIILLAFILLETSHTNFSSYFNPVYMFLALTASTTINRFSLKKD